MSDLFARFEYLVRSASQYTEARSVPSGGLHPFDERNIHPNLPEVVRRLFDDGHYAQATFESFKFIDKEVQRFARVSGSGYKLMMQAFAADAPKIGLTALSSESEKDEQKGYQFLFAGSILAIRNPRGHEYAVTESPDQCLDHLALASLLLHRLEGAGFK
jgi:uncharacterized protein (TIGR02391 family)